MDKLTHYFNEAERLYVVDQCSIAEIASRLRIAEKILRTWKEEGDWETKRLQHLRNIQSFHQELYQFSCKLLESIKEDLAAGEKVDPGRLYTLTRLLPLLDKVQANEEVEVRRAQEKLTDLAEEVIRLIKRDVLRI